MVRLPESFISRMKDELGSDFPSFIQCYEKPPVRGLRVNTLKISPGEFESISPFPITPGCPIPEGFVLGDAEGIGRHPYHLAGLFYMQEPSAMSVIAASGADPSGLRVLDMCAAPGGKSGGVAARMRGKGILVSNEIVPKRALQLSFNLERLGVTNSAVISAKPDAIASALPGFFDIVLVDAPCSGEGMFRKDPEALAEWSPEHVKACAVRQSLILESAEKCVAGGGALVYSTCTFSREENEGVIESFLNKHSDFSVEHTERLLPHASCGEGHFVCRMRRAGESSSREYYRTVEGTRDKNAFSALSGFAGSVLQNGLPDGTIHLAGDTLRLIPHGMPADVLRLHPISVGVELGELRKGRFEPSHGFFMAALSQEYQRGLVFDPVDPHLAAFLSGNTVPCPEDWRGFSAVNVRAGGRAFPVGFGKAVDGVMKNHLPKGLYLK